MQKRSMRLKREGRKWGTFALLLVFAVGALAGFWSRGWWEAQDGLPWQQGSSDQPLSASLEQPLGEGQGASDLTDETTPEPERITHTVAAGETLSSIAARYGTTTQQLLFLNDLDNADTIIEGQELVVQDVMPDVFYGRVVDNNLELVRTSDYGQQEDVLLQVAVFDSEPVVRISPDRGWVLYTESAIASTDGAITWVSRIDGTDRRTIIPSDLRLPKELGQRWHPDSSRVVYHFENNLYLTTREGGEPQLVTSDLVEGVVGPLYAFAPDGGRLAYIQSEGSRRILQVRDLNSGEDELIKVLPEGELGELHWPEGRSIYFTQGDGEASEIYRITPNLGANLQAQTENGLIERDLVFAPSMQQLAFGVSGLSGNRSGENGIWLMSLSDKRLSQLSTIETGTLDLMQFDDTDMVWYAVSETGSTALFAQPVLRRQAQRVVSGREIILFDAL